MHRKKNTIIVKPGCEFRKNKTTSNTTEMTHGYKNYNSEGLQLREIMVSNFYNVSAKIFATVTSNEILYVRAISTCDKMKQLLQLI